MEFGDVVALFGVLRCPGVAKYCESGGGARECLGDVGDDAVSRQELRVIDGGVAPSYSSSLELRHTWLVLGWHSIRRIPLGDQVMFNWGMAFQTASINSSPYFWNEDFGCHVD